MTQATLIPKILIANRGEIACRIIRTCRQMGIASVAVYSDADAHALHVELADEAVYIGSSPATESYLNIPRIIEAAQRTGAAAVHPGYGFLAENADFAEAVIHAGLIFIGPLPQSIRAMGQKHHAKRSLKSVPMLPGYNDDDQSDAALTQAATQIGYPVIVKASAGGGGKGMRRVDAPEALSEALSAARREAKQAFGDDTLIIEKLIHNPRHVEIQILGDHYGNVIALGERECSIQRRHQKLIEETPCLLLTHELRSAMSHTAVDIGKQLAYRSAGTVEFLLDEDLNYYFIEVNTRLQVEHPVTEAVYGVDLVALQILIAEGHSVLDSNFRFIPEGHAIELRICAEDPLNDFLPAIGPVLAWSELDLPEVRLDSGIRAGDAVSIHYDPMLAKLIAWGMERPQAIRRLDYALGQLQLLGLKSNIAFLRRVIRHPDFIKGATTTRFIEDHPELLIPAAELPTLVLIAVAVAQEETSTAPAQAAYWRNNPYRPARHAFGHGGAVHEVLLTAQPGGAYQAQVGAEVYQVQAAYDSRSGALRLSVDGHSRKLSALRDGERWWVGLDAEAYVLHWQNPLPAFQRNAVVAGTLRAPMPGQVVNVLVEEGQTVVEGTLLMTIEAMKMEHHIRAPYEGVVKEIYYGPGDAVQVDEVLLELIPPGDPA